MNTGSLSSGNNVQRNWSSHSIPLVRVKTVNDGVLVRVSSYTRTTAWSVTLDTDGLYGVGEVLIAMVGCCTTHN